MMVRGLCCCLVNENANNVVEKIMPAVHYLSQMEEVDLPVDPMSREEGLVPTTVWEPTGTNYPHRKWQVWAAAAVKWRWLLRTSQSLVAMCLYGACTLLRLPWRPLGLQFLLALVIAPLHAGLYHVLSLNRAGSYYNNFAEMFTQLPRLWQNMHRRDLAGYPAEIAHERREGIVRTVNGLESAILFVLCNWASLLAAMALSRDTLVLDNRWRVTETLAFFLLHRLLGANVLRGRYAGLLQPESMWQFECDSDGVECHMRPLMVHPTPSY